MGEGLPKSVNIKRECITVMGEGIKVVDAKITIDEFQFLY
jgi:hypothetical protein